jgi:hypothetical protein
VRLILKLARLPRVQWHWFIRALARVSLVRVGLWFLPLAKVQQLATFRQHKRLTQTTDDTECVVWAVRKSSRFVPKATCLVQALAVQTLLLENGQVAQIHIGVALDINEQFLAHAWVEYQGQIIIGETQTREYTPLITLAD